MPVMIGRRWMWPRADVANFRRVMAGQPTRRANPAADDTKLVTVEQMAKLLGVHARTVTRRVAEARALRQEWADNIKADYPPDVRAGMDDAWDADARKAAEAEAAEADEAASKGEQSLRKT